MEPWVLVVLSYLLGSIPAGLVLARLVGAGDIRSVGSGNIGATNVTRNAGKLAGGGTLLFDVLKGALPTWWASTLWEEPLPAVLVGVAAILGHDFSIFLKLRGGKGVATGLGVYLVLTPMAAGLALALFVAVAVTSRTVAVASIAACASLPLWMLLWDAYSSTPYIGSAAFVAVLTIARHHENIRRLLAGRENRL